MSLRVACFAAVFMALLAAPAPGVPLNHGTFLPNTPFSVDGSMVEMYGGNLTEFMADVNVSGIGKVGEFRFTYDTWSGTQSGRPTGGGALAGGFFLTPGELDLKVKRGFQLGWVQTVTATISGENVWKAPDGTEFPDTGLSKADPDYPNQSLPVGPGTPQPTVAFQDFPNRFPEDGNQFWLGELALVCKDFMLHLACVMDSFLWGFGVIGDQPGVPGSITPDAPRLFGPATQSFLDTLNGHFNGQNGSTDWDFSLNSCFLVPVPSTFALLIPGLLVALYYDRRRRKQCGEHKKPKAP